MRKLRLSYRNLNCRVPGGLYRLKYYFKQQKEELFFLAEKNSDPQIDLDSGFVQLTQKLQDYLLLQLLLPNGCQAVFFRRVALAKTVKESSVNTCKSIQKLFKNPEKSPLVQTWRRNPARLVSFRNFFTTKKIFS